MPSYLVTGATQGIGLAFLKHLAKDPANIIFGLARNPGPLEAKIKEAGLSNVVVLQGDVGDLDSLKRAAEAVTKITNGSLDILINNAAWISDVTEFTTLSDYASEPETLTEDLLKAFRVNTLGVINVVNVFLPLVRKGSVGYKKVINISTGIADIDAINDLEFDGATSYSISKAAANAVIAKYNATHKHEGILFLSISPGFVTTERSTEGFQRGGTKGQELGAKFVKYAPHFVKPLSPEESVIAVLDVIQQKSIEKGDGGSFISHLGTKQWL